MTLLLIPPVAVLAPIAARLLVRWVRIPVVVFELLLGILIGPSVLGWAHPSAFVHTLSQFGLAMLFFVAGTEIGLFALVACHTGRVSQKVRVAAVAADVWCDLRGVCVTEGAGAGRSIPRLV